MRWFKRLFPTYREGYRDGLRDGAEAQRALKIEAAKAWKEGFEQGLRNRSLVFFPGDKPQLAGPSNTYNTEKGIQASASA